MVNNNVDQKPNLSRQNSDGEPMPMASCIKGGCYYKKQSNSNLKTSSGELPYTTAYIIKVRTFYCVVFILSVVSLYLNFIFIRKTYKILY
jgi:hypothetical protein